RNADRRDADARAAAPTVSRHGAASGDFITLAAGAPSVGATAAPRKLVDFAALRAVNDDVVAWIYAEGTPIDYPVVLGDDNAYYLDHTFFGRPGSAGAIFIDAANRADFSDGNTVVYGHHMKDGSMFAGLPNYGDQAYYDAHPVIYLYTPDGDYAIELFSGYVRDASALPIDFAGPEAFLGYVDAVRQLSDFESDVVVAADDRIVTLITCTYNFDDARYAVHGRLAPLAGAAA
ncbi:MAG: class B sortase, partial [Clostridiales bacterium]|nr:class B sortase [Clostridiales bacterium]